MARDQVEQQLEDVLQLSDQEQSELLAGLPPASPGNPQEDPQPPTSSEADDEKLGHMCIVLSPQVRRQLMRGEPLIVGTSTASVEAFFHRLISVCQMGAHMPVMFQTLGGAVTVANIKKRKNGIIAKPKVDRYPVPSLSVPPSTAGKRQRGSISSTAISPGAPPVSILEETPDQEKQKKAGVERDEIPLEAIRQYLTEHRYFPGWNANAKRNLRKRCKDFILDPAGSGTLLYKRKDVLLPCIEDRAQRMSIIWESHVVDHRRRDGLLNTIREKYYWKGMFQDINKVLESCEVCSQQRQLKAKDREDGATVDDEAETADSSPKTRKTPSTAKVSRAKKLKPNDLADDILFTPVQEEEAADKYPETSEVPIAGVPL